VLLCLFIADTDLVCKIIRKVITLYSDILLNVGHIHKSPYMFQHLHCNYTVQVLEYMMTCLTARNMDKVKCPEIFQVGSCSLSGTVFYIKHNSFFTIGHF
jgi:hypothetical protein